MSCTLLGAGLTQLCMRRLTTAVGGNCDDMCLEAMDWMGTVHLRSRFSAADVLPTAQAELAKTNAILRYNSSDLHLL